MKYKNCSRKVVSLLVFVVCSAGYTQNNVLTETAFVKWTQDHTSEIKTIEPGSGFDDLRPLQKAIGDARLVFIGESRHDAHEHFRCKHRLVEFLVEEMGFTLFAMEESLPYGDKINTYVLGGEGDPEALLNDMGNWYVWDTREVLELIQWMRAYNADPRHEKKIEFCGIDVTDPVPAIENIAVYLEKVDTGSAESFKKKMDEVKLLDPHLRSERDLTIRYMHLSDDEVDSLGVFLTKCYDVLQDNSVEYIRTSSKHEFDWILQQVTCVQAAHDIYRMRRPGAEGTALSREDGMTNNIRWLLGRDDRRIVLWASNLHIARAAMSLSGYRQQEPIEAELFGSAIGKDLGDDLYSIGFSFCQANYKNLKPAEDDILGSVFSQVGPERFFLDLRAIPESSPVYGWFNRRHNMSVGAFGDGAVVSLNPIEAYDAIIFTHTITATELSPVAQKRWDAWSNQ